MRPRQADHLRSGVQDQPGQHVSIKSPNWPGSEVHVYNPSTLGGQGRRMACAQEFETSLGNMEKSHLYKKLKNSLVRWCMPMVPATGEAEVGGSLEHRRVSLCGPGQSAVVQSRLTATSTYLRGSSKPSTSAFHVSGTQTEFWHVAQLVSNSWALNTKVSHVWRHMTVVPATREAESVESLEPRRQRLQSTILKSNFKNIPTPGVVAHACNPSTLGGQAFGASVDEGCPPEKVFPHSPSSNRELSTRAIASKILQT
ncbi:hypothetical protein AAY473_034505 [Plecturocebus cupreus]